MFFLLVDLRERKPLDSGKVRQENESRLIKNTVGFVVGLGIVSAQGQESA